MSSKTKAAGKQDAQPALTPKLRFPEFRDAKGWEQVPLEQLASRITAKNPGGDCTRVLTNSAERGVLDQRDYFEKDIATPGNLEGYYVVDRGDYVYNPRISSTAPVGPISRNNIGQGVMSPLYTVFRFNSASTEFYSHYFKTTCWHMYLRQVASTGARHDRMSISVGDFVAMPLPTPRLAEQQKIASCLTTLDEVIAAQSQKLDALKTHKKGLMQQLFPREGETLPRLRFPEFKNAAEWEENTIGDFGTVVTGNTPGTARREFYGGGIPFVSPADISDLRFVDDTKTTLTVLGFNETRPIKANSVLFVCIGSTIGKLAQNRRECATNQQLNSVIPNAKHAGEFIYYALSHHAEAIAKLAGRHAVPIVNKSLFSSVKMLAPKLPEQQRIATCLTSLDDLITAQSAKLEALKTHKKGLMQQLFPFPEEVEA